MNPVDLLKETLEHYLTFGGSDIREWLLEENKRLHDEGIKVNDSLGLPAAEYVRSPELRARWLLGGLRGIFLADTRGVQLIVMVGRWAAEAKKALIVAGVLEDDGDPSEPPLVVEMAKGRSVGQGYAHVIAADEVLKHKDQWADALQKYQDSH